jgi:hypothetical protein
MVRYLSIDNKHPKIDFARKCSFNYTLKSGMWISTYIIFTCVKGKEDSGVVATHGH